MSADTVSDSDITAAFKPLGVGPSEPILPLVALLPAAGYVELVGSASDSFFQLRQIIGKGRFGAVRGAHCALRVVQ